ncbi:DUF4062 domain-containing protein [Bacillus cereus]|uniref:DUF4062 domain-containing protein n=1 Tax=Bacillus cereus TaxID=1396 RepID=UPI0018F3A34C|nr:DUF4062 domain-containing protein [Bacillus cereus]MBJ7983003.1 DUF4062 domain-containing protein [Bacillus cereus]
MPNSAKIFISSAAERQLKTLRRNLKTELNEAGHDAIIFEDGDFAPWDTNTLRTCVSKVKECQVFILLISKKQGTFLKEERTTPTYIEFHTALQEEQYILPFVDEEVHELYFQYVRSDIHQRVSEYYKEHNRKPDYIDQIVEEVVESHPYKERLKDVDNYVWGFLYNVEGACGWLYKLDFADAVNFYKNVKAYLSDRLARSIKLLPLENDIINNAEQAEEFAKFQEFSSFSLGLLKEGGILDFKGLLERLVRNLKGSEVVHLPGSYIAEILVKYEDCNAVSLYKHKDGLMNLVAFNGAITPTQLYDLKSDDSFVVDTYNKDTQGVYYNEHKTLLYCTIKAGEYVLCFHFPLEKKWPETKVNSFRDDFYNAIMTSNSSIYFEFIQQLLGGIKDE